jgi:hypothetical protein
MFKCLLVKHSSYFATVFQGTGVSEMTLHCQLYLFQGFMQWLKFQYNRDLENETLGSEHLDWALTEYNISHDLFQDEDPLLGNNGGSTHAVEENIDFYLFADIYKIPRLRQDATDRLLWALYAGESHWDDIVPPKILQELYTKTTAGSSLRKVFVDVFCAWAHWDIHDPEMSLSMHISTLSALPKDFLADLMEKHRSQAPVSVPTDWHQLKALEPCDYHNHKDAMEWEQCDGSRVKWNDSM